MSRLPPPCLSVNLPIMEKPLSSELTPTRLGFPTEFPYEFDSPAFSPGFTSPGDSTETEDESSDDEEDFLAGLTRRLAPSTQRLPPPSINIKAEVRTPQNLFFVMIIKSSKPFLTDFYRFCSAGETSSRSDFATVNTEWTRKLFKLRKQKPYPSTATNAYGVVS